MSSFKVIGSVAAVHARDVRNSAWGLGFEKLDRNVFDPEKAYDRVAELGVKWVRIQSGWERTEQTKGVYEFEWLDTIVDNLLSRGLQPWICLCYGNGIFDENAAKVFGAVGCAPIHNEEQKRAWYNYVVATTSRYRNRVTHFEIWNEPDGLWCWKHGTNGTEYGEFAKATATAIREGNPEAEVIGFAFCGRNYEWLTDALETGVATCLDSISYHAYVPNEWDVPERQRIFRALCRHYNPNLKFIQGETGTQSREGGSGALREGAWSQEKQMKFLARQLIAHFAEGTEINSYFSCLDMIEALKGTVGDVNSYLDYGYFGVLGADFDSEGRSTGEYTPKPSYRTLQVLAAIFREDITVEPLPVQFQTGLRSPRFMRDDDSEDGVLSYGFRKSDGSTGFVYWKPVELLTSGGYESTVTLNVMGLEGTPVLVNLLDGTIHEIPEEAIETKTKNYRRFLHLPIHDYPMLLAFNDFVQ